MIRELIFCFHIHLHKWLFFENEDNLQMYVTVKLGRSPDYDGFEASLNYSLD